jgi:hypothetical protein
VLAAVGLGVAGYRWAQQRQKPDTRFGAGFEGRRRSSVNWLWGF